MESNGQGRQCGECQLCCFVYTVPEMDKPRMEPCKHQCDQGCAIHNGPRPELCTAFRCEWIELESPLPDEFRPDKCGMIFQLQARLPGGRRFYIVNMANPYACYVRQNAKVLIG